MKNIFKLSIFTLLLISTAACTNSEDITILTPSAASVLKMPAAGTAFILEKAKTADKATTIDWDYAKYEGAQTAVSYEIEMAKSGTNFKDITVLSVTTDHSKDLTVGELNAAALNIGLVPFTAQNADIRIKSYVGKGGIVQYSNVSKLSITPYPAWDNWGIIGSATPNGWNDPDTNLDYDLSTKKYSYTGPLTVGEYKFRLDDGWNTNFGDDGNNLSLEAGGSNIPITVAGNYKIVIDFTAKSYTVTKN